METNKPYLDRMHEERSQLAERITKLSAFILHNNLFKGFDKEKRDIMEGQLQAMNLYSYFLDKRIAMEEKAH
jgi:hypothetical protein